MITLGPSSSYWLVFVSAATAACVTLLMQPMLSRRALPILLEMPSEKTEKPHDRPVKKRGHPTPDDFRFLTRTGEKISSMMNAGQTLTSKVWPDFSTDLEGRRGIFIACSQPLIPTSNEDDMQRQKTWILLAVIATVKYTEANRRAVDYIAITDPLGLSGDRWYYELEMKTAAGIHSQFINEGLSLEESCRLIMASWHRVTSQPTLQ
jgi:hypothetical protein